MHISKERREGTRVCDREAGRRDQWQAARDLQNRRGWKDRHRLHGTKPENHALGARRYAPQTPVPLESHHAPAPAPVLQRARRGETLQGSAGLLRRIAVLWRNLRRSVTMRTAGQASSRIYPSCAPLSSTIFAGVITAPCPDASTLHTQFKFDGLTSEDLY